MKILALVFLLMIPVAVEATTLEITHGTWGFLSLFNDWIGQNSIGGPNWNVIPFASCCSGPFDSASLRLDGVTYPALPAVPPFPPPNNWILHFDLMGGESLIFGGSGGVPMWQGEEIVNHPFTATGQINVLDPITSAPTSFSLFGHGQYSILLEDLNNFGHPCPPGGLCYVAERYTFIPEPSTLVLLAVAGVGFAFTHVGRRFGRAPHQMHRVP